MKTIIAGIRTLRSYSPVELAITVSGFRPTEIVSGGAEGADRLGEYWAKIHEIPIKRFPADWAKHGKAAGPIRNREMAQYADALVAIWDGESRGTKNMIDEARKRGIKVHVHLVSKARYQPSIPVRQDARKTNPAAQPCQTCKHSNCKDRGPGYCAEIEQDVKGWFTGCIRWKAR